MSFPLVEQPAAGEVRPAVAQIADIAPDRLAQTQQHDGEAEGHGDQEPHADDTQPVGHIAVLPRHQHRVERPVDGKAGRSEEHTSELQSLMRISYADFCLKKKKNSVDKTTNPTK